MNDVRGIGGDGRGDVIFLKTGSGSLTRAPLTGYVSEEVLQYLSAIHPDLLGGDQIDDSNPPHWLLITREADVPDGEAASDRWSLDHLLVDHRGVPTFVEVKRASDPRIGREVGGHMLDYAANASTYWATDRIRSIAAARVGSVEALDRQILQLLSLAGEPDEAPIDQFWSSVDENLRTGKLRLLFVADELPRELRRVIEFLNEHMPSVEVLGVELRRYEGDGVEALVPRVVVQTERARAVRDGVRSNAPRRKTTDREFLELLEPRVREFFVALLAQAKAEGFAVSWGTKGFSVRVARPDGDLVSPLYGSPPGAVGREVAVIEVYLKELREDERPEELREALLQTGDFRERGQFTVGAEVLPQTASQLVDILAVVWSTYQRVRALP